MSTQMQILFVPKNNLPKLSVLNLSRKLLFLLPFPSIKGLILKIIYIIDTNITVEIYRIKIIARDDFT